MRMHASQRTIKKRVDLLLAVHSVLAAITGTLAVVLPHGVLREECAAMPVPQLSADWQVHCEPLANALCPFCDAPRALQCSSGS